MSTSFVYLHGFVSEAIYCFLRESQNGWGWKGLLEVIWSKPRAQVGPPVAPDHIQMAFKYLKDGRLHNHLGQPVQMLGHPHSEKVFP